MLRRAWRAGAVLAVALVLAALPAHAQRAPVDPTFAAQAESLFPERLGNFKRHSISSAAPGRVGAAYTLTGQSGGGPLVDIFMAAIGQPLVEDFASTEHMIGVIYEDLQVLRDLAPPPSAPGALGRLWQGSRHGRAVTTGVMILHRGGWRIKVRATVPAEMGEAGWGEVEALMRAYAWTPPA